MLSHLQNVKSKRADIPNPEIPVRIQLALDKANEICQSKSLWLLLFQLIDKLAKNNQFCFLCYLSYSSDIAIRNYYCRWAAVYATSIIYYSSDSTSKSAFNSKYLSISFTACKCGNSWSIICSSSSL